MLKLGYKASTEQFSPQELLKFATHAEKVGFDSVMLSDHFQPWQHTDAHAPNALILLSALGQVTNKITLGTSVLTPTFRYHPSIIAQMLATLGVLFPGRIVLGIGTGEAINEVTSTGIAWPNFNERIERLKEAAKLIKRLWTEERVTFNGKYFRTKQATLYDRPKREIPIYVAGTGPRVARLAGEIANGFICTSGKASQLYKQDLIPNLHRGLKNSGRQPHEFEYTIEVKVSYDTDRQYATQVTRHWAALSLSQEEKIDITDPMAMEKTANALSINKVASRWIVSTDPGEHIERLSEIIKLGFNHLVFHAPGPDQIRFLNLYAKQILPQLRNKFQ